MDNATLTTIILPIVISACGVGFTALVGAIGAGWLFYSNRQTNKDKEFGVSSAYTREQKRSKQVYDEASEKNAQQQLILSFGDLVKQSIESSNGQVGELIKAQSDNTKEILSRLAAIEASFNQIVIYLRERAGLSLVGGGDIGTALIQREAEKRTAAIVEAADAKLQAEKDVGNGGKT